MVEVSLQFESPDELETELRGVIEAVAMADDTDLEGETFAESMEYVGRQAQLAYDAKILGEFFNRKHICKVTQQE